MKMKEEIERNGSEERQISVHGCGIEKQTKDQRSIEEGGKNEDRAGGVRVNSGIAPTTKRTIGSVDAVDAAEPKRQRTEATAFNIRQTVVDALKNSPIAYELETLQQTVCLEPWVLGRYSCEVKADLFRILTPLQPVRIDLFGSAVMNIAFRDSDLNFFVELKNTNEDCAVVLGSVVTLLQASGNFKDIEFANDVRVSAIKCIHIGSGFMCDLNFKNTISVLKSSILGHLLTFDMRIFKLAVILKHWLKVHDLIGVCAMSSYDALWLLLFYLQQLKDAVLPPLDTFQSSMPPFFIDQANLAFNFTLPNVARNHQRTYELLLGFFDFYAKFDFETQLICPLMGRALCRADFRAMFPEYFAVDRNDAIDVTMNFCQPICIQDPFEKRRSLPQRFSMHKFAVMRKAMTEAAEICRSILCDDNMCNGLLYALFSNVQNMHVNAAEASQIALHPNGIAFDVQNHIAGALDYGDMMANPNGYRSMFMENFRPPMILEMTIVNQTYDKVHSIQFHVNDKELNLVRKYLKAVKPSELHDDTDNIDCRRIWAQFYLHFVGEILYKMLRVTPANADILLHEKNALSKTFYMPSFGASCRLWVDTSSYTVINVDFLGNLQNAQIHQHQMEFFDRLQKSLLPSFVTPYFKHLVKYVLFNPTADIRKAIRTDGGHASKDIDSNLLNKGSSSSMKLEPSSHTMMMVEQYLHMWNSPMNKPIDGDLQMWRVWAPYCIQFIIDILVNVMGYQLIENGSRGFPNTIFSKSFEVIGMQDVSFQRKSVRKSIVDVDDELNLEIATTLRSLAGEQPAIRPIRAIFHIWTNAEMCDQVTIDVINLRSTTLRQSWLQIRHRVPRLVDAYFAKLKKNQLVMNFASSVDGVETAFEQPAVRVSGRSGSIKSRLDDRVPSRSNIDNIP